MTIYTLTWIQNGEFEYFTLRSQDCFSAIDAFVNGGINSFPKECSCHSLYCASKGVSRLVARQATYQGV